MRDRHSRSSAPPSSLAPPKTAAAAAFVVAIAFLLASHHATTTIAAFQLPPRHRQSRRPVPSSSSLSTASSGPGPDSGPEPVTRRKGSSPASASSSSAGGFGFGFGGGGNDGGGRRRRARSLSGGRGVAPGSGTRALAASANCFDRIRGACGKDATSDVYVRSPSNDPGLYWFVGKVVRVIDDVANSPSSTSTSSTSFLAGEVYPTASEAVLSQKRLILEYAKNELRPQNMGGPYSNDLELWIAPGDSEMDVVRNKVTLVRVVGSSRDLRDGFDVDDVGYNPEIYVGDEKEKGGLRVVRDSEGRPVKPVFDITV
ncbi:hypothetical protein ACHAW5_010851 [Stephanodiscus triporus]|uniref:Uncharacterized protein n=1 Tax=Stephanodiscus triporus TaxID=2934178 RepID=A0ABD3NEI6_9STRA